MQGFRKFEDIRADYGLVGSQSTESSSLTGQQQPLSWTGSAGSDSQPKSLENRAVLAYAAGTDSLRKNEGTNEPQVQAVQTVWHLNNRCQACVFAQSQLGCPRGDSCPFCHEGHPLMSRRQGLRRKPRDRMTQRISRLFRGQDLIEVHDAQLNVRF